MWLSVWLIAFLLQLQEQAKESEYNRRKLERARQEVVHHLTRIKTEKEYLEREVGYCFSL